MQLVLHTSTLHIADGPSEDSGVSMVPGRTTFEKLWPSSHLKVPSVAVSGPMNLWATIMAAVGRHHSLESTGAMTLHVGLSAHVLVICLADHILAVGTASHVFTIQIVPRVLVLPATSYALVLHVADGPPEAPGCP